MNESLKQKLKVKYIPKLHANENYNKSHVVQ